MAQQKWNLGDIRPPGRDREVRSRSKRAIQDVRAPAYMTPVGSLSSEDETEQQEALERYRMHRGVPDGRRRKILLCTVVVLVFLGVGFLATLFLQGTEFTVYPKYKDVTVQATFTAYQNPKIDTLGYELLTLEETGGRTVTATGSEATEERATGEIIIFNAHSKDPQRLIKNTRFEAKDGKIFKIQDSIIIPGYTTAATGEKVPGSITTKVFADVAGETYNIEPGHFTIPGLKGSAQFDAMYAESKAPMQGGFVGTKLIVEDTELTRTKDAIQAELKDTLLERLRSERPAGFELYESAARITFESLTSVDAGENQATIRERAVLEAPLFAEVDFARYLAQNTIVGYGNEEVRVEQPQSLTFSYVTASSSQATTNWHSIDFNLVGSAKVVWTYDTEQLRSELAGATKGDVPDILLKYQPAIERATTVMRPFWRRSFPKNPEKIKIIEVLDTEVE